MMATSNESKVKNKGAKIAVLTVICLIVLFCGIVSNWTYVYTIASPSGQGNAIIYTEGGILHIDADFYVDDPNNQSSKLSYQGSLNGRAEDEDGCPSGLIWSKDGTLVIALTPGGDYGIGYDYAAHKSLGEVSKSRFKQLLQPRGGAGATVTFSPYWEDYYRQSRHAWPWEIWRFNSLRH